MTHGIVPKLPGSKEVMASTIAQASRRWRVFSAILVVCVASATAVWVFSPVRRQAAATPAPALGVELSNEIQRGAYVARAADCAPCHTAPDGKPFSGGRILKTDFGDMASPNITPDTETGIGGWTRNEFATAVREGVAPHLGFLYPTMSYTSYSKMSDSDIDALYAYIMSQPPVRAPRTEMSLSFPFNLRMLLAGWRKLYFDNSEFKADPAVSDVVNRGAYLVQGAAHCAECHTPRDALGGFDRSRPLAGATIDGFWAPNLTTDPKTGLGGWSEDDIYAYLSGKDTPHGGPFGPMHEVVAESTSHLTEGDNRAIAAYLHQLKPIESVSTGVLDRSLAQASVTRGYAAYKANCAACHRMGGDGVPGLAPPLAGHHALSASSQNVIMPVIAGLSGQTGRLSMPAFELDDQTVADIANYVRSAMGGVTDATATADQVASARAKLH
ncbi:c-type cytochrome [Rhizobium daejeonense]|uniref:C-type cytochrome n=1 Tax=Rhizobium daejeonense TaxID=240521 RepID=A0A6M1RWN1_9HYPH|nr:cytochrome c [Rhizobium daejeonense]NGO65932.1 c-type cytochrome [Rhizobium daejeonense]